MIAAFLLILGAIQQSTPPEKDIPDQIVEKVVSVPSELSKKSDAEVGKMWLEEKRRLRRQGQIHDMESCLKARGLDVEMFSRMIRYLHDRMSKMPDDEVKHVWIDIKPEHTSRAGLIVAAGTSGVLDVSLETDGFVDYFRNLFDSEEPFLIVPIARPGAVVASPETLKAQDIAGIHVRRIYAEAVPVYELVWADKPRERRSVFVNTKKVHEAPVQLPRLKIGM